MASIQARHSRSCKLGRPWTTFDELALDGCTCKPMYHVVTRHDGKLIRDPVGHNRKLAERARHKLEEAKEQGTYEPPKTIRFDKWADEWHRSLRRAKESTRRSYISTLAHAKEAFGSKPVRAIGPADIDRFLEVVQRNAPSTQAKHLRVLKAVFKVAVRRGYAARNPIELLDESQRPQPEKREAAYFERAELPRLIAEVPEGLYRTLARVALMTGMRQAELLALTWGDVDLAEGSIHVRRIYTPGIGISTPKSKTSRREVHLVPEAVELLGQWWGELGRPGEDVLVFPGSNRDGYLIGSTITRQVIYPAMKRAGILREGPTGELRGFHSLRHTYAKTALESGAQLTWLSKQLGHSSVVITANVYGHWEKAAAKAEAQKLAGAFTV